MNTENINIIRLATPQHRIAARFLDLGLYFATFGIGWSIWNLIMWGSGQTPGKQILKIRVMNESTREFAHWGQMFVREGLLTSLFTIFWYLPMLSYLVIRQGQGLHFSPAVLIGLIGSIGVAVGILIFDFTKLFKPERKRLIDYWANTYVVNEAVN